MTEPNYIHENTGLPRRERRKFYNPKTGKVKNLPKEYREPATNEPYRRH
jgi:hypothetical protein